MKNTIRTAIAVAAASVLLFGCDLTESVRDQALQQEALEGPNAIQQVTAPVYRSMGNPLFRHNEMNNLQGVSSMEQIVPFRGGTDWFDGGRFIEMHQHTWTPAHTTVISVWQDFTQGVGRGAIAEQTISARGGDPDLLAEVRGLKALYNYWLLDLYNVAFEKRPEDVGTSALSTVYRDGDAVDYLYGELNALEDELPEIEVVGETRFNRSAATALKARLLLNKAVYMDRYATDPSHNADDLNEVIALTSDLIDGGRFELESENYFYLFGRENEGDPEIIFAYDQKPETGSDDAMAYFHASRSRYGNPYDRSKTGSDGGALTQDFFDLWEGERDDPRYFHRFLPDEGSISPEAYRWNRGVQVGQQYGIIPDLEGSGTYLEDDEGNLLILPLIDQARTGDAMIYTREVGLESDRGHLAGARSLKWDIDKEQINDESDVNIPVLRLGEMYLTRAEAYARLGNFAAALDDINELRAARGARPLDADEMSSLDDLEREWIYEMYHEHHTRTIQIRFGSFTQGTWRDKPVTAVERRVFPIPQEAIDAARSEPGYLEQNPGY